MRYVMAFLFCVGLLFVCSALSISCSDDTDLTPAEAGIEASVADGGQDGAQEASQADVAVETAANDDAATTQEAATADAAQTGD